jgi:hypothetical protein
MAMNDEQQQRFDMLRSGECIPVAYVQAYYGLSWPLADNAGEAFQQYRGNLRRPKQCPDDSVSRYEIEGFMSRANVLPHKWMAARLGMMEDSLDELLGHLPQLGMQPQRYAVLPGFVAESLTEDIIRFLPGLKFKTFRDHNAYCERLHADLKQALQFDIQRLFCATSVAMEDYPRFSMHFDCLTLEPVSTKHSVWLDFHKPLNLAPDRCSKLFYAENRDELKPFIMGSEPEDIGEYVAFLEGGAHA